jgi:hypothetical protein
VCVLRLNKNFMHAALEEANICTQREHQTQITSLLESHSTRSHSRRRKTASVGQRRETGHCYFQRPAFPPIGNPLVPIFDDVTLNCPELTAIYLKASVIAMESSAFRDRSNAQTGTCRPRLAGNSPSAGRRPSRRKRNVSFARW